MPHDTAHAGQGGVYICNECVALCAEIFEEQGESGDQAKRRDERVGAVLRRYPDDEDFQRLVRELVADLAVARQAAERAKPTTQGCGAVPRP